MQVYEEQSWAREAVTYVASCKDLRMKLAKEALHLFILSGEHVSDYFSIELKSDVNLLPATFALRTSTFTTLPAG